MDSATAGLHIIEKVAIGGTQGGAAATVWGVFTLNQWLAIGGFLLACASFLFQVCCTWYFKSKHLALAEARFAADLAETSNDDGE